MLFNETVAIYCENHTEHTDTLCGQNVEFYCVKANGTWVLEGQLYTSYKSLVLKTGSNL
jgi:hypothetical protein